MSNPSAAATLAAPSSRSFLEKLNSNWHERALQGYMLVVLAHWAEHLTQAIQIYALGWPVPESRGVLGLWYPWLVRSEALHYGYAIVMLIGLWVLRTGFTGRSRTWWMIAFWIQFWHHIEHALLQGQALVGHNLFDKPVPMSIIQLWVPRVELHLFYNTVVFIPMAIGMYFHMFPPAGEVTHGAVCSCAWKPKQKRASAARTAS
ncbi:hypothetical protein [Engelhardtia mirabilis]|uniref:Uncharacterized protein n=1 Tax=Engelhardtia mirabilis TaxID=2528011 RepID=A0A518BHR0_9BACT|nr:hypothetical protein Pla133_15980 [Planctomycetes bacterium Pla133]QDV00848.1 hypothetical protein Pla86_15970 [Planctomycetes bacterium Pla86]